MIIYLKVFHLPERICNSCFKVLICWPGTVAHIWEWEMAWVQELETSLGNMAKPHLYWKHKKLAWHGGVWLQSQLLKRQSWEDHLSPGGQGYSELWWHHCTPAWVTEQDPVFLSLSLSLSVYTYIYIYIYTYTYILKWVYVCSPSYLGDYEVASQSSYEVVTIIIPILQMRKEPFVQGHTANKW